jgi:hypothetical protein
MKRLTKAQIADANDDIRKFNAERARIAADLDVMCRVCEATAYELELCREHFEQYHDWKKHNGYDLSSTNRVAEFVAAGGYEE